jgi:hypothetical protein
MSNNLVAKTFPRYFVKQAVNVSKDLLESWMPLYFTRQPKENYKTKRHNIKTRYLCKGKGER